MIMFERRADLGTNAGDQRECRLELAVATLTTLSASPPTTAATWPKLEKNLPMPAKDAMRGVYQI